MRNVKYNKIFGLYSLLLPLAVIVLFTFVMFYGTTEADTVSRPFGKISDYISFITALFISPILIITNIVLCFLTIEKNVKFLLNIIITVLNIILCLQLMLTIGNMWFLICTILIIEPRYFIIWLRYLIYFIKNYKTLHMKESSEKDSETSSE